MLLGPWFTPTEQAGIRMRICEVSPSATSLQKDLGRHLWTMVSSQNTSATCSEPQGGKAAMEGMLMPSPPLSELQLSITPLCSLAGPHLCQAVSKLPILPFGYLLPHSPLTQEHRAMAPGPTTSLMASGKVLPMGALGGTGLPQLWDAVSSPWSPAPSSSCYPHQQFQGSVMPSIGQ